MKIQVQFAFEIIDGIKLANSDLLQLRAVNCVCQLSFPFDEGQRVDKVLAVERGLLQEAASICHWGMSESLGDLACIQIACSVGTLDKVSLNSTFFVRNLVLDLSISAIFVLEFLNRSKLAFFFTADERMLLDTSWTYLVHVKLGAREQS